MNPKIDLTDPTALLFAVVDALAPLGLDAAVYGGLALAAYGEPRETKDADLAVAGIAGADAERALQAAGLDASLAFDRVTFGGNLVTQITVLPGERATGLDVVDFVSPRDEQYAARALGRALTGTLRGRRVRVVSPEDFVVLEVLSTRERDVEDASTVWRALAARLDVPLIEREIQALVAVVRDHDVLGRLTRVKAG